MSDLPPADWYTDPEDESQYRYWDGTTWTDHRAPRHSDAPAQTTGGESEPMRDVGTFFSDSFKIFGRSWVRFLAAVLIEVVASIVAFALVYFAADAILNGEATAVLERLVESDQYTDAENEAWFESLQFDWSFINFLPAVLGALLLWVAGSLSYSVMTRMTMSAEIGRTETQSDTYKHAATRVLRLMGVDVQIFALYLAILIAGLILSLIAALITPFLLIITIPAFLVVMVMAVPTVIIASVVAASGPRRSSLRYARELSRGRFWKCMGRMLMILAMLLLASIAVSAVTEAVGLGADSTAGQIIQIVAVAPLYAVLAIAVALLYLDLGGERADD